MDITLSAPGTVVPSLRGRDLLIRWIEMARFSIIYVEVDALDDWRNGEICHLLLASNFFLADTQSGALSCNDAAGMVGLNFPIPAYGLDTGDFLETVNNVVLLSEAWEARLDVMNKEQETLTEQAQQAVLEGGETPEPSFTAEQFLHIWSVSEVPQRRNLRYAAIWHAFSRKRY